MNLFDDKGHGCISLLVDQVDVLIRQKIEFSPVAQPEIGLLAGGIDYSSMSLYKKNATNGTGERYQNKTTV